ncbi:caldesmon-like [Neodiprion pinetum]|uniref:caldesmon-like n=1 Tax=Neodiprion pinetum TaxID=441929 RepID=UPI0037241E26
MPIETRTGSKKESGASVDDSLQLKYTETDIEFIKQEVSNKEKRLQKEKEALEERQAEIDKKSKHLSEQFRQQEAELEKKQRAIESSKDAGLSEEVQKKLARLAELEAKEIANANTKTQRHNPTEGPAQDVPHPTQPTKGIVEEIKYPTQFKTSKVDDSKNPAQLSASVTDVKIRDTNEATGRSKMDEPRLGPVEDTQLSELLRKKAEIDREVQLLVAQNSRGTDRAVTQSIELATDATFREPGPVCTRSKDELRLEAEILHFKKKAERKKGDLRKSVAPQKPNPVDSYRPDPLSRGAIGRNALNSENDHISIKSVVSVPTDDEDLNLEAEALAREALIRRIQKENREKLKNLRGGIAGPDLGPQELGEPGVPGELVLDKDLEIRLREQEIWERELELQEQELAYQAALADPYRERRRKLAEREEQLKKREQALKDKISGITRPQVTQVVNAEQAPVPPTLPLAEQSISVKDALAVVPKFDGKNITVMQFNRACKRALEMVTPSLEGYLTRLIRSKLADRAYAVIEDESFATLQGLLDKLTEVFAPIRSANHYRGELGQLYKYADEHVLDYIGRTRDIKTGLIEAERRKNRELTNAEIIRLDEEVCEAFVGGLPSDCRNAVLIKGYSNLKTAYERAIDASKALELDRDRARSRGASRAESNNAEPCKHCGRSNHLTDQCRAIRRPAVSRPVENRESCTLCGRSTHSTANCYKNKPPSSQQSTARNTNVVECSYCKSIGHSYNECRKRRYHETISRNNSGNGAGPSGNTGSPRVTRANAIETEEVETGPSAST